MTNFNGITPKAIELLSENRFNDSKAFYEEHKDELKQLATIPMRQIVLDLAEMMTQLTIKCIRILCTPFLAFAETPVAPKAR